MDILAMTKAYQPDTVALRRALHARPEAAPEEQLETLTFIEAELDKLGINHERIPGGGVIGYIECGKPGRTLLLRSDVDALRIQEAVHNLKGDRTCISEKDGLMHACGHDAHMAMLLTTARILKFQAHELAGRILLLFEEGEEGGGNIKTICRWMHRNALHIDGCYAAHVRWDVPSGQVAVCKGAAMCGQMRFRLTIKGHSGHGSRPDLACNTIDCFHLIYTAWQTLRMTRVRPDTSLTWSVCSLHAGDSHNVIPDKLTCEGTIRMMDVESGDAFWQAFHSSAVRIAKECGCTAALERVMYLLPLAGDDTCQTLFKQAAREVLGQDAVFTADPWMASESFSYLSVMYPSVFSFVGIRNEEKGCGANHHTPEFDLDEDGMMAGVAAACAYARAYLLTEPDTTAFKPLCSNMDELMDLVEKQPQLR